MTENLTIEMVQFRSLKGMDEKVFLDASDAMMTDLKKQRGFIDRELLKSEDDQWIDIVHWKSLGDAQLAARNVMSIPTCLTFFKMMDEGTVKMMHFRQVRKYKD